MDAYAVGVSFDVALTGMDALKQAADKFADLSKTIGALETRLAGIKTTIDAAFSNTKIASFQDGLESSLKTIKSISTEAAHTKLPTTVGAPDAITGAAPSATGLRSATVVEEARIHGATRGEWATAEWENRDFDAKQRFREKQDAQERRTQIAIQKAIDAEELRNRKEAHAAVIEAERTLRKQEQEEKSAQLSAQRVAAAESRRALAADNAARRAEAKAANFQRGLEVADAMKMNRELDRAQRLQHTGGFLASIGGVYMLGRGIESAVHAATNLNTEISRMRLQGYSEADINRAHDKALDVATSVKGVTTTEAMMTNRKASAVIGEENVTPALLKALAVETRAITQMTGESPDTVMQQMLRGVESRQHLTEGGKFSEGAAMRETMDYTRAILASGGDVKTTALTHTLQYSSEGSKYQKDPDQAFALASAATVSLGKIAGMELNTVFRNLSMGKLATKPVGFEVLRESGLVDPGQVPLLPNTKAALTGGRGATHTLPLAQMGVTIDPAKGLLQNIDEVVDKLQKAHPTWDVAKLANSVFDVSTARFVTWARSETGRAAIEREEKNIGRIPKDPEALQRFMEFDNAALAIEDFKKSMETLAGEVINLTGIMNLLGVATKAAHSLSVAAHEHPQAANAVQDLAIGAGALIAWNKIAPFIIRNIPGMAVRAAGVGAAEVGVGAVAAAGVGGVAGTVAGGLAAMAGPIGWTILGLSAVVATLNAFGFSIKDVGNAVDKAAAKILPKSMFATGASSDPKAFDDMMARLPYVVASVEEAIAEWLRGLPDQIENALKALPERIKEGLEVIDDWVRGLPEVLRGVAHDINRERDPVSSAQIQAEREQNRRAMGVTSPTNMPTNDGYDAMGLPLNVNPGDYGDLGSDSRVPKAIFPTPKAGDPAGPIKPDFPGHRRIPLPPPVPHVPYETSSVPGRIAQGPGPLPMAYRPGLAGEAAALPNPYAVSAAVPASEHRLETPQPADFYARNLYVEHAILSGGSGGSGGGGDLGGGAGMPSHRGLPIGGMHGGGGGHASAPPVPYQAGHIIDEMNITPAQYNATKEAIGGIESRGRYDIMGGSSGRFAGKYQMGQAEIAETAAKLGEPVPSRAQFLHDPVMQERFMEAYTAGHHETLMRDSAQYRAATPEQQLQILGYAHNQGAGGAEKWLQTHRAGSDAFGTSGTAYSHAIESALSKTPEPSFAAPPADPSSNSGLQVMPPAANYSHSSQVDIHLDNEVIAQHTFNTMFNTPSAISSGPTGFDKGMSPWSPGTSLPR